VTIGLIEDQLLFRRGIKSIINGWRDFEVVFESENGFSVPEKMKNCEQVPEIILVDLTLPPNGYEEYKG